MSVRSAEDRADDRRAWLEERRTGVGSSDAAAVCGFSPFKTALHVYFDKVDPGWEAPPADGPLYWGLRLEGVLAEEYARRSGHLLFPGGLVRSPLFPWQLATPDRVRDDGRLVELKTTGRPNYEEWGAEGTDQVPVPYLLQVQHQMAVTGADRADLAVLIAGQEYRVYTVPRNPDCITLLTVIEEGFWARVQGRSPPPPDWRHPETPALVERLHRPDPGLIEVHLGADALALLDQYRMLAQDERAAAQGKARVKAELAAVMGAAAVAHFPDGSRVSRKTVRRAGYSVEPTEYVSFHVHQPKEPR